MEEVMLEMLEKANEFIKDLLPYITNKGALDLTQEYSRTLDDMVCEIKRMQEEEGW